MSAQLHGMARIPKPLLLPPPRTKCGFWGLNSEARADKTSNLPMEPSPRLHPHLLLSLSSPFLTTQNALPPVAVWTQDVGLSQLRSFPFHSRARKKPVPLSSSWPLFLKSGCHHLICVCETCLADSGLVFNFPVSTTRQEDCAGPGMALIALKWQLRLQRRCSRSQLQRGSSVSAFSEESGELST